MTYMFLTIVLAAYMVAALFITNIMAAAETVDSVVVDVVSDDGSGYVSAEQLRAELPALDPSQLVVTAPLDSIERILNNLDNIEHAEAFISYDGSRSYVKVEAQPMKPVARVFDRDKSYYINRAGKRLTANARYHIDVPVVTGDFSRRITPLHVLPFLDYLHKDPTFAAMVSAINVEPDGDIIVIPMLDGHVINFGDTTRLRDKVVRLMRVYQDVMKVKGWNYYDTISLKWNGQVVATRRKKSQPQPMILFDTETQPEAIDLGYMDTVPLIQPH